MMVEQSARNMDVHWNGIFHRFIWYIKNVVRLILLPWMVLLFLIIAYLATEWAAGDLDRNGGMTGLFQSVGLHPHTTYEGFLWVTGFGVFFAMVWLLWRVVDTLLGAAVRQIQKKTGLGAWITRKTTPLSNALAHFEKIHPNILTSLVMVLVLVAAIFISVLPTPRNQIIVPPPVVQQSIQASSYSRVLMRVPNAPVGERPEPATRTISGKAIVTQIGPHTYQVRMIP